FSQASLAELKCEKPKNVFEPHMTLETSTPPMEVSGMAEPGVMGYWGVGVLGDSGIGFSFLEVPGLVENPLPVLRQ
ncbi:MAG: hypothetical protein Q7O66_14115, partial [Dehalococcoidia bacterium]|nr:hypothetical protein [Dehalococcoidia bacterium]